MFITASFVVEDFRNTQGYTYAIVYRSTDGGITWSMQPIYAEDVPGVRAKSVTRTSRNILGLNDGSLILGVGAGTSTDYLWRSFDQGQTWDKSLESQVIGYDEAANGDPWYGEMVFVQAANGDLLGIDRSNPDALPPVSYTHLDVYKRQSGTCASGGAFTVAAKRAVISVPLGVLQAGSIEFSPTPWTALTQARRLRMGPVMRMTLIFRSRFWAGLDGPKAPAEAVSYTHLCCCVPWPVTTRLATMARASSGPDRNRLSVGRCSMSAGRDSSQTQCRPD